MAPATIVWDWEKEFEKTTRYPIITDEQILIRAKQSIVTPFDEILETITNAK